MKVVAFTLILVLLNRIGEFGDTKLLRSLVLKVIASSSQEEVVYKENRVDDKWVGDGNFMSFGYGKS